MAIGFIVVLQVVLTAAAALLVMRVFRRQRRGFGTPRERATLQTLGFATTTMGAFRKGLSSRAAEDVLPEVCAQSGAAAAALFDTHALLAFVASEAGSIEQHRRHVDNDAAGVLAGC